MKQSIIGVFKLLRAKDAWKQTRNWHQTRFSDGRQCSDRHLRQLKQTKKISEFITLKIWQDVQVIMSGLPRAGEVNAHKCANERKCHWFSVAFSGSYKRNNCEIEVLYNRCVTSIPRLWYTRESHESASLERETKYECEFFFGSRLTGPILDWYQQWLISNKKMECKSKIRQNGDLMIFNYSNGRLLRNQQNERSSKDLCNSTIYVQRVPRKKEKCASRLIQNRSWTWLHILVNHPSFCGNRLKFSSGSLGQ